MSPRMSAAAKGRRPRNVAQKGLEEPVPVQASSMTGAKISHRTGVAGRFEGSVQLLAGLAVIRLQGHVTRDSMQVCRSVLHSALRVRTPYVVVELSRAGVDEESIPVLRLMDRAAARSGVTLWWSGLTAQAGSVLSRTDLAAPSRCFASVPAALNAVEQPHI